MFFVYILFSEVTKKYYVGQTNEMNQRLQRHNNGLVKSTKGGIPWTLIKTFSFKTRSEAVIMETKIKKRGIKRFLSDLNASLEQQNI